MKKLLLASLLCTTMLTPTSAEAGPLGGILFAAFSSFGPFATTVAATGFLSTSLGSFLFRAGLGLALNALQSRGGGGDRGYQVTAFGSALDHQIIYGETRVAGARVFDAATGPSNRFLHRVIAFAGHEIEEFSEVYLNDYKLTVNLTTGAVTSAQNSEETTTRYNNLVRVIARNGSDDQTAIPEMVSEIPQWTNNHRLRGIAYLYIRLQFNADTFPNGIPEITATVKGKKVFDPRTSDTTYSNNPALCIRDYLTSSYGLGCLSTEIDDVLVAQAANVCEETVEGEDRYTCNGSFLTSAQPGEVITQMLSSMGGLLWYAQGNWRMKPAYYTSPIISLDENDLRTGLQISTRNSRRDSFNTVKGTFRGEETEWQVSDYKAVSENVFVVADGGFENTVDLDLPFTTSHKTAQRIARIALRQQREQVTVTAQFGLRGFAVQVGDVVQLTNSRMGWSNKEFEVVSWTFTFTEDLALEVQMRLRETSSDVYTDVSGAVFEKNNTNLLSPFFVPNVGLTASVVQHILNEKVTNIILVDVSASTPEFIDTVEVQFREIGSPVWINVGSGEIGRFEIIDVEPSEYEVRARGINSFGVKGAYEILDFVDVSGKITPPSDVTGLFADVAGGFVTVDWAPIPDLDLSHYTVRHAVEEVGATWANATTASAKVPRPASEVTLPVKPGTYMLRAEDKSGNRSINYTPVVVPLAVLDTFATSLSLNENGVFVGQRSGVTLDTDTLVISTTSTAPSQGEYTLNSFLDAGSVKKFRSRVDVYTVRQDSASGEWDDIPGLFNQFPGNFDDWTGDVQFADTDVRTYISTTNTNPYDLSLGTSSLSFTQNDTVSGTDDFTGVTRSQPVFAEIDLTFPASPQGVIWEQGSAAGSPRGVYVGVTSGDLTFRAGDSSTLLGTTGTAKFTVSASTFANKSGKLFVAITRNPERIQAWWLEDSTSTYVYLGSAIATAGFPSDQWASGNPGGIGVLSGAVPTGEDSTSWGGTITSADFWTDTNPVATHWSDWKEFKAGEFSARYARFKVGLKSISPDVTPRVSRLTAMMEFN